MNLAGHDGKHGEANGHAVPPEKASDKGQVKIDAGLRPEEHYTRRLPRWRYNLREALLPLLRQETPYLDAMQKRLRTPALDSYFAMTANLGTHTFFMIMLPILFWCGNTNMARALVEVLAAGVYVTGVMKDLLCLPRPLSPPLKRITMSGSAALEYGFPSTHSANAVSVAVYALYHLTHASDDAFTYPAARTVLLMMSGFYATSIVFGRLYCGMHGFSDVVIGSTIGALITAVQVMYGEAFDYWICTGTYVRPLIAGLAILVAVRTHPEPADDCPCFDDMVAFNGVIMGVLTGAWHFAMSGYDMGEPAPGHVPFDLATIGWPRTILRIALGVLIVFAWRGVMKPACLKVLPPLFRILERLNLALPRRFFLNASQYRYVPRLRKDDNVIPSASEIPKLISNFRHPRKRAVSTGPQSAADAYETLAYRQKKRRESISELQSSPVSEHKGGNLLDNLNVPSTPDLRKTVSHSTALRTTEAFPPFVPDAVEDQLTDSMALEQQHRDTAAEEKEDRDLFLRLEKPRVRYDVEVVTKLVVYFGIGFLAVAGIPILFEWVGLGMGKGQ